MGLYGISLSSDMGNYLNINTLLYTKRCTEGRHLFPACVSQGDVPLTRTAASTNSHRKLRGRPSRLQRTLSDESMCGAVASKQYRNPGDAFFTAAIPTRSRREHFFSDPRYKATFLSLMCSIYDLCCNVYAYVNV